MSRASCRERRLDERVQNAACPRYGLSSSCAVDDPADSVDQQDERDQEKNYFDSKPRSIDCHE